jgi:hypothetical protein
MLSGSGTMLAGRQMITVIIAKGTKHEQAMAVLSR